MSPVVQEMSILRIRRWRGHLWHLPWGFSIGRLHVTWFDAWLGRCTWEDFVIWRKLG